MSSVKVKCITTGCTETATVTQGKRRQTLNCPHCGPLNFQTLTGQTLLKKWVEQHGASPEKSTASQKPQSETESVNERPTDTKSEAPETKPKKRGFFPRLVR